MRTRTNGVLLAGDGTRQIDKWHRGQRIFARLGPVSQDEAEAWLRQRQADVDAQIEHQLRSGDEQLFAAAAQRYLNECRERGTRSLETIAYHVTLLLPYVGGLSMGEVSSESFSAFRAARAASGASATTINRSLEVARTICNRAARVWRHNGRPWLSAPPLIEMLPERPRTPRPISWAEQAQLMPHLPAHLQRMVLFALNTGARDDNVCGLRWEWERQVPELQRSVFVIPPEAFKTNRHHVLVLNDVAWRVIEECRGTHAEFVFAWRRERVVHLDRPARMAYHRIGTINNTAFQAARQAAGLAQVRVHDLRHTYGQRLRDAGVSEEDRALLLGHAIDGMPQHYATATVARLVEAANRVQETRDRTTLLRVVNG